jgi:hypothetical protein
MDGGGWIFGAAVMVLLIVLAVIAVVWLLRNQASGAGSGRSTVEGGSASDLLDRRLVSGEINEDEYRRLRAALSDTPRRASLHPSHRRRRSRQDYSWPCQPWALTMFSITFPTLRIPRS